ncbi:alpha/beta fold hydrolase [Plantibacter sp. YIM 135249]|uniref:alpha/beta fold hydrolase n=1 Tax=Plantibacter sp. YIM 135249 TaxID=3423918 RepID=UPI003D3561CA
MNTDQNAGANAGRNVRRNAAASAASRTTRFLDVPGGRIAYDVAGSGPLVVLVPGMGDLRSTYRFTVPAIVAAGGTAVSVDLRGHGDSTADFPGYGDEATAGDIIALLAHLGSPAVVVGNSMGAGAAVIVAAERPELVDGLVLVGPFVRNPAAASPFMRGVMRVLMARPWAATVWKRYLSTLSPAAKAADFEAHRDEIVRSLRRPGYAKSFSLTTRLSHDVAERRLGDVAAPVLVVMGEKDPDFPDPVAEASWIADMLRGSAVLVAGGGHYPQSERAEDFAAAVVPFLATVWGGPSAADAGDADADAAAADAAGSDGSGDRA